LDKPIEERNNITNQVSSITLGHNRWVITCFNYREFASYLLFDRPKFEIYHRLKTEVLNHSTHFLTIQGELHYKGAKDSWKGIDPD